MSETAKTKPGSAATHKQLSKLPNCHGIAILAETYKRVVRLNNAITNMGQ